MNRESLPQLSFFTSKNTKRIEIEKWLKDISRFNAKSIYDLTWENFYKELHKLGIKEFLNQYGYSHKKNLQLAIAKSELGQKRISLYDFEKNTKQKLHLLLRDSFFAKVKRQAYFNPKNHKFSTIHYYIYYYSLNFTALSLGFSSKQSFLNFFAQTCYVSECIENRSENLRMSIQSLKEVDSFTLRKELTDLYDKPIPKNKNFIKYNYTLEELKLALENEDTVFVVANLGGGNAYAVNKKLQTLRPLVNINLQALKLQSWESLKVNTPIFIWKIKLYQLFLGQIRLLELDTRLYTPRVLYTFGISFHSQFFTSHSTQHPMEEREIPVNPHNPPLSFFCH
ncbi:hypothetical protein [Rickettsiella endosymbiont of Rhagonycha lignosa]|uniref:hypothetical protein n=1 Tax=Rickettsiella endosymbiont of Rhagonycha lignosa TaxID=3077937 RepID=UPI00313EBBA0